MRNKNSEYVVNYRKKGDKDAPVYSETFLAASTREASVLARETLDDFIVTRIKKRKFSFRELKRKFEGATLTDDDLITLAQTPGIWFEKDGDHYECRDMAVPAGEKGDSFDFLIE